MGKRGQPCAAVVLVACALAGWLAAVRGFPAWGQEQVAPASWLAQPSAEPIGRWPVPVRISQATGGAPPASVAGDAAPSPAIAPAAPPPGIQPVRPAGKTAPSDREAEVQLPYQSRLPDELRPRPVTPEAQAEQNRFIPKIIDPQQELNLVMGQPRILTFAEWATKPQVRLYLADESVVRWDIISDTEVAVVGLQPGTTVLTIWFQDPSHAAGKRVLSFRVRVFEDPQLRATVADLERQIAELFPDSHVRLSIVRDRLVVRGQAKDAIEAGQIVTVLAQTRNRQRPGPSSQQLPAAGFADPVPAPEARTANVYVDQDPLQQMEDAALRRAAIDQVAVAQAGIINLLTIPGEQQVTLQVTLAEINRSALRTVGSDLRIGGSGNVSFVSLALPDGFTPANGGNLLVNYPDFRLTLNALRDLGFARTLAEPNLTALNGQAASFRAGDTFPVPNAQASFGGVGQSVSQQFVGVDVQFIPYIVDRDRIRLRVRGQVSARDDEEGAEIAGTAVPGTRTRDFFTTVELRDGQTLALAGLMQTTLAGDARRVPWLGDLPLVGNLFGNKNNSATEQELVVLVTPELAHPLEKEQALPLPGADVFEPTDREFYLGNRLESRRLEDFRSAARTDHSRIQYFERCCQDQYIIGPSGFSDRTGYFGTAEVHPAAGQPIPAPAMPLPPPQ